MSLYRIAIIFTFSIMLSACLGGKKLAEKPSIVSPEAPSANQTASSSSGNIYKSKSADKENTPEESSMESAKSEVNTKREGVDPLTTTKKLKAGKVDGQQRKATFQKKSICEMQPLSDWFYSFSENAAATFKECKTYPPEKNFERYLKKQRLHDVGEISRKVVHKNLKGVLEHAVRVGEIMSKVCFNRQGEVVASKVIECSNNYTRERLEGYQEAMLQYKWSTNRNAPPIECMKIFFSTSLQ